MWSGARSCRVHESRGWQDTAYTTLPLNCRDGTELTAAGRGARDVYREHELRQGPPSEPQPQHTSRMNGCYDPSTGFCIEDADDFGRTNQRGSGAALASRSDHPYNKLANADRACRAEVPQYRPSSRP